MIDQMATHPSVPPHTLVADSHSQRMSDCGFFSLVHSQFEAPTLAGSSPLLQRKTRGQKGADRGYQLQDLRSVIMRRSYQSEISTAIYIVYKAENTRAFPS